MTTRQTIGRILAAGLFLLPGALLKATGTGACGTAPLPQGTYRISSPYGPRVHPLSPTHEVKMHWGLDLAARAGTPVSAVGDAVTEFAGRWGCYGNVVILRHRGAVNHGAVLTLYAHLSRISVRRGVRVHRGEVIGTVGASGCVTGPHLHWEVWLLKQRVNPSLLCALLRLS